MSPELFLPAPKKITKKHLSFLMPVFLVILMVLTVYQKSSFFLSQKGQFEVSLFPQMPTTHFNFARELIDCGQKELAEQEFEVGKKQVEVLDNFYLGWLFKRDLLATYDIVFREDQLRKELEELDRQLKKTPYSWQLLLKRAVLAHQLHEDEKVKEAWEAAYWLDPNNEEVLELGERLEKKK